MKDCAWTDDFTLGSEWRCAAQRLSAQLADLSPAPRSIPCKGFTLHPENTKVQIVNTEFLWRKTL